MAGIQFLLSMLLVATVHVLGHDEDHLQPISGDCSKLRPLVKVTPKQLNGRQWVVTHDSYLESPEETCETFSLRLEGDVLHSTENVQTTSGRSWNINVKFQIDENNEGFYIDEHGGSAVVLNADAALDAFCFAECTKLEHGTGHGAHFFCGTKSGKATPYQTRLITKSIAEARKMGIDLPVNPIKTDCP